MRLPRRIVLSAATMAIASCGTADRERAAAQRGPLIVYNAGSLARPLRAALDSFAARERVDVQQENAGSLETARKLTELGKIPDVIALADQEVFPQLLMPAHTSWYLRFARNRMVLAYTDASRYAAEIETRNWHRILLRPGVEIGRADPNRDPNGYRTLMVMQLAERHYSVPGLAARLLAAAVDRNVRPKEADLVALLQAGELDYAWSYESMARAAGLRYVALPGQIDLGNPADSLFYATAQVRVAGTGRDSLRIAGAPIVYALSVPRNAPHADLGARFVAFLISDSGRRILRAQSLDVLDAPALAGNGVPARVANAVPALRE